MLKSLPSKKCKKCFASLTERLGQCVLKMSDDLFICMPSNSTNSISSSSSKIIEDGGIKLFLSPAVERLRCSLRYLFFKEKNIRKKGYQQSLGFLTRCNSRNGTSASHHDESVSGFFDDDMESTTANNAVNFSLNDFYMDNPVEKFCDVAVKLKRTNRTFVHNNFTVSTDGQQSVPIFQTDNLLKIYNIFTSESVDAELKRNAGEQLAIMISTGDERLHRAFISLDGVNYCLRYLRNSVLKSGSHAAKQHLFLCNLEVRRESA